MKEFLVEILCHQPRMLCLKFKVLNMSTFVWNISEKLKLFTEDEELVTNALETIVNLAPLLDLRIFSSSKPSYIKIT